GMVTTLERSVEMSHLAVHFSPIYYVMLPVFIIFPYPDTLQVLQVLIAASGVIPLYLIMKELKTGKFMRMLFLIMYIASPAIISSSLYHLHENCFLVPLLLSVIYFGIKQKTIPFFIFGALTLIVKEDAGLYLVFIGLYFAVCELFSGKSSTYKRKNVIHGLILTFASLGYFLIVTNYLNTSGDGAMFWRYNNINGYSDHGLIGILLSVFQDPAYFFATFFSPSKMATMIILLASVGFLPLFVRNKTVLILAVPIIIMNFASNYSYQHQFGFQYFYGSGSLLLFMALLAEKDNREKPMFDRVFCKFKPLHLLGLIGMAVSFSFGTSYLISSELGYRIYQSDPAKFDSMRLTLESIPREKSVVATTFLTPLLANRYYLYDYDYYNILNADQQIDYVIVDMRMNQADINKIRLRCMQAGFIESPLSTEYILIFVPDTNTP
ncbi:MAG: DUF2079 domain-containing protein, partial [Candidatus Izemoplasmatales bacterium]|nr:DUF2079 domain-containing protein [Candidatus Izemoplasmatales bacterium]